MGMATAYKCDKCGVLFAEKKQDINVEFKKSKLVQSYIVVAVALGLDLCAECVGVALDKAIDILKK